MSKEKRLDFTLFSQADVNVLLAAVPIVDEKIKAYKLISDAYSAKRDYEKAIGFLIKANELLHLTSNNLLKITIIVFSITLLLTAPRAHIIYSIE